MSPKEQADGLEPRQPRKALLEVDGLTVRFGGIVALDGVSFDIFENTICGVIGPNGAGKTSLFNCISRLYEPQAGDIRFRGQSLLAIRRAKLATLGIARTFQNLALFTTMTVRENIQVGAHAIARGGFLACGLRLPHARASEREVATLSDALILECHLEPFADRLVAELPFGIKKRVELARALALDPDLLLLDEPAAGLSHEEVETLAADIVAIRDRRRVAILLVEHHMNLVMRISDQVIALDFGRLIAKGAPAEIRENADVVRAYLGKAA
jgi:branched-chain amino acid transport system ATP-binding protein